MKNLSVHRSPMSNKKKSKAETVQILQSELAAIKNAYNELRGFDQRKRLALDDVPVFELSIDADATITSLNNGVEQVLGAPAEYYIGKNFADLLVSNEVDKHYRLLDVFKHAGYLKKRVWKMQTVNGDIITVIHSARALFDDNGNFTGGVGFVLDITDSVNAHQALLKSEKEKAIILNTMSGGVSYVDPELNVVWANRVFCEITGLSESLIEGKKCFDFCPGNGLLCHGCPLTKAQTTKQKQIGEVTIHDQVFIMAVHPVFDEDNNLTALVQVINDITEIKLLERQIIELSNNERKRIGHDLHDGLGQMLTGISCLVETLLTMVDESREEEYGIVNKIAEYTRGTRLLMKDIISGLCPINEDTGDITASLACLAARIENVSKVACVFDCPAPILLDDINVSSHVFLIVQEAINNALKHSGCFCIRIGVYKEDNCIRIIISDDGKGFTDNDRQLGGYGFRIMRYRASIIGAKLLITGNEKSGTTISIILENYLINIV